MKHNLIFLFQEQFELMLVQVPPRIMGQLRGRLIRQDWWADIILQIQREFGE